MSMPKEIKIFGDEKFDLSRLFPDVGDASSLILSTPSDNYSASVVARAVEDCDAHLLNLNVGERNEEDSTVTVYLRVNHRNGESVARSLERFGYNVIAVENSEENELDPNAARRRVEELIRYLEI